MSKKKGERVMSDKFTFSSADEIQVVEFGLARAGLTHLEVKALASGDLLSRVRAVLNGQAKIVPVGEDSSRVITLNETTIVVNLGASPQLPFAGAKVEQHLGDGWAIAERRTDGLYMNGRKVVLRLSKKQAGGKIIRGHELREELSDKPVLNANILDVLFENPHLIPEEWKKDKRGNTRYIFFWGTVYRDSGGGLYVRYLCFDDGAWRRNYCWLGFDWSSDDPAALLASM